MYWKVYLDIYNKFTCLSETSFYDYNLRLVLNEYMNTFYVANGGKLYNCKPYKGSIIICFLIKGWNERIDKIYKVYKVLKLDFDNFKLKFLN